MRILSVLVMALVLAAAAWLVPAFRPVLVWTAAALGLSWLLLRRSGSFLTGKTSNGYRAASSLLSFQEAGH